MHLYPLHRHNSPEYPDHRNWKCILLHQGDCSFTPDKCAGRPPRSQDHFTQTRARDHGLRRSHHQFLESYPTRRYQEWQDRKTRAAKQRRTMAGDSESCLHRGSRIRLWSYRPAASHRAKASDGSRRTVVLSWSLRRQLLAEQWPRSRRFGRRRRAACPPPVTGLGASLFSAASSICLLRRGCNVVIRLVWCLFGC